MTNQGKISWLLSAEIKDDEDLGFVEFKQYDDHVMVSYENLEVVGKAFIELGKELKENKRQIKIAKLKKELAELENNNGQQD